MADRHDRSSCWEPPMSVRSILGLALVGAAFAVAPFAYWLDSAWGVVAAGLAVPGFALPSTKSVSRKVARPGALDCFDTSVDVPPGVHDVKGYPGSIVFDHHEGDAHD